MHETITTAVQILRKYPEAEDADIYERLLAAGINKHTAARLLEFLPLAYGRTMIGRSGARLCQTYHRMDEHGHLIERPLEAQPLWHEVVAYAHADTHRGISRQEFLAIALRSAEVRALNKALNDGLKATDVVFTQPVFTNPDDHPGILLEGDQLSATPDSERKRKWWQFWK